MLVVLLDDAGFGSSSAFAGPCSTPNFERLAGQGLKFNRFHSTALCSPSRQALLTGRNHHAVGMGGITEIATSAPGYNSIRPSSASTAGWAASARTRSSNMKNKSHSVTAEVTVPEDGGRGVIIAQGGAFAGWCLYLHEGRPKYCHNLAGLLRFYVEAESAVPAGEHQVRMELTYDGGGLAKGGDVALYIDGEQVGEGRVEATVPMIYSADETCGCDGHGRQRGLHQRERSLQRQGEMGAARRRRGRRRPPHHAGRTSPRRRGDPIGPSLEEESHGHRPG